ncbi:esterase [Polaromonas sp.]|uniref:esterase n=1 Tax=Polaromonas sp. TaxID=1869339 RepID=UPI00286A5C2F|nr:esterase [Polaromonas sp.]
MNLADTETIELLPASGSPRPLFVLLHDAGGTAADMLALGQLLGDAFAESAVLIPEGLMRADGLPALVAWLRAQQQRFGVLQPDTALAGFGAGADLALALSDAHDGLVGRVLAFGATYPALPGSFKTAPALTLLHLLHGHNDKRAPVGRAREGFERLMALGADATLDLARSVGHELHPALMEQAVTRLQTCVPLRHWRAV